MQTSDGKGNGIVRSGKLDLELLCSPSAYRLIRFISLRILCVVRISLITERPENHISEEIRSEKNFNFIKIL